MKVLDAEGNRVDEHAVGAVPATGSLRRTRVPVRSRVDPREIVDAERQEPAILAAIQYGPTA